MRLFSFFSSLVIIIIQLAALNENSNSFANQEPVTDFLHSLCRNVEDIKDHSLKLGLSNGRKIRRGCMTLI